MKSADEDTYEQLKRGRGMKEHSTLFKLVGLKTSLDFILVLHSQQEAEFQGILVWGAFRILARQSN